MDDRHVTATILLQQYAQQLKKQQQQQQQQQQQPPPPPGLSSSLHSGSGATTTTPGTTPPLSPFSSAQSGPMASFKPGSKERGRGIIERHFKTEMCRNFPNCRYGARCAFAHDKSELRRLSLEEMEMTGRIPNAAKFRIFPCASWISTGACPYNDRCVFIHDPRVKGPSKAWLYATPGSSSSRRGTSAKNSPLFWPDLPTPADQTDALLTASIEYEVVPRNPQPTYHEATVWFLWAGYKAVMQHVDALGKDDDMLGRALYGPSCIAPVRRLPVFQRMSETFRPGSDEEAKAMARFAMAFPPAMPNVPSLNAADSGAAASYVLGVAGTSAAATPSASPFSSPPLLPAGAPTPTAAAAATTGTATPTAAAAATTGTGLGTSGTAAVDSFFTPPWGTEWRAQQEQQLQSLVEPAAATTTETATKPSALPQPSSNAPLLSSLLKKLPTGSGSLWPPSTPSSRAGSTAPPSPLLNPQAAAAMAAAVAVATPGNPASPSLSSVGSSSSSGKGGL